MADSVAGSWASLAGTEIVNDARTIAYLENGLGPGSVAVYGNCGCSNILDLLDCQPEEVVLDQFVDLPGVAGNYISTPDTDANSLQGTDHAYKAPGVGSYVSAPDTAALGITGDLDVRAKLTVDRWAPGTGSTRQVIICQQFTGDPQRAWLFALTTTGNLSFEWYPLGTGASIIQKNSTSAVPFTAGQTGWVRVVHDVDNGAAGNDVLFYTSTDGNNWTQLGTTVTTAGVATRINSTDPISIGSRFAGIENLTGLVHKVIIKDGINGITVASPEFDSTTWAIGEIAAAAHSDAQGNLWTIAGQGSIVANAERRSLRLSGAGTRASTPDTAALDIVGDLDIRVKVAMDDWTPTVQQTFVSKYTGPGNQRSYWFYLLPAGTLQFQWSADGIAALGATSTIATGITDGSIKWVRVIIDVNNGAAGRDVKFYTSDDGVTWTQLGTTVTTAGVTSIFSSTTEMQIGAQSGGDTIIGNVFYVEVRNGIDGTIVASPNFEARPWDVGDTAASTGTDSSGLVWTLSGAGAVIQRAYASDIDIRVKLSMDDWTPSTTSTFIAKYNTTSQRAFRLFIDNLGKVNWSYSAQGNTPFTTTFSTPLGFVDGSIKWLRLTHDIGGGTNNVKLYVSSDGVTWTLLIQVTAIDIWGFYDSTAIIEIGSYNAGMNDQLAGNIYHAEVRNGIDGTIVAEFDANEAPATSLTTPNTVVDPVTGAIWTINGTGWVWGGNSLDLYPTLANSLRLPGVAGNYVSTPDVVDISITGDIDVRMKLTMDDWTPAFPFGRVLGKWLSNNRSFYLEVGSAGNIRFAFSLDGLAEIGAQSSVVTGIADGSTKWIRATRIAATGILNFYLSDDGVIWTQLGGTVVSTAGNLFDGNAALQVGATDGSGSNAMQGFVHRAEVYNGINGTLVAWFDATQITATGARTPTTVSQSGRTWTVNGTGWYWDVSGSFYPYYPYVSPAVYTTPAIDDAPWYTPDIAASAGFLGFVVDEFVGLDSPFTRSVQQAIGNGGVLTRSRLKTRELHWRGFLFGASCCSVQYGLRWLTQTLSRFDSGCKDCFGDDLELLICCPLDGEASTGGDSPFRTLKGVGLLEGPTIVSERKTCTSNCSTGCGGSCILEVEFTLVATQPYFYSPEIPVYDCVNLYEGSVAPVTDTEVVCGPADCSDFLFEDVVGSVCPLPALPPTATYTNSCWSIMDTPRAQYIGVSRSLWNDLDEVVPIISITTGDYTAGKIQLGFYSSNNDAPCSDILLSEPQCDIICDEIQIISIPSNSTFYIDGRTRKMAVICEGGVAFPGERLTTGPWSWPSFNCFGFCMEVLFDLGVANSAQSAFEQVCISVSLVPRTF